MAKLVVPKGCVVHQINFLPKRKVEVRYRCAGDLGQREYRTTDRAGNVTISNYPSKTIRGVSSIRLPGGLSVVAGGVAGFMRCHRERGEIACAPSSSGGTAGLGGLRRRRRQRRRR